MSILTGSRHRAFLLGLLAVIAAGLFFWSRHSSDPVYQKIPLSTWVRQLSEGDVKQRQAALVAIRALQEPAIPILIAALQKRGERSRKVVMWFAMQFPSQRNRYIPVEVERGQAATALGAIGPTAQAAVPALITASSETNAFCAARAKAALIQIQQEPTDFLILPAPEVPNFTNWLATAEILLCLGSNIQSSAQEMVAAISADKDHGFEIVETLGFNHRQPYASVQILRGLLKDKNWGIRGNVLNHLMFQRYFAKPELGEIMQCLNDTNALVRGNAFYALIILFGEETAARVSGRGAATNAPPPVRRN